MTWEDIELDPQTTETMYIQDNRFLCYRKTNDGREIAVTDQLFGGLLTIGKYLGRTYDDGWQYEDIVGAILAFATWDEIADKEPSGWCRCIRTGRRRPGGDPANEFILIDT